MIIFRASSYQQRNQLEHTMPHGGADSISLPFSLLLHVSLEIGLNKFKKNCGKCRKTRQIIRLLMPRDGADRIRRARSRRSGSDKGINLMMDDKCKAHCRHTHTHRRSLVFCPLMENHLSCACLEGKTSPREKERILLEGSRVKEKKCHN